MTATPDRGEEIALAWANVLRGHLLRFVPPLDDRFESCWQLYLLAEELINDQNQDDTDETLVQAGDVLLFGIGARAVKTFRGVLFLCALGHGPQASMLNRSLIEDALTAHWIGQNRDEAVRRINLSERQIQRLSIEAFTSKGLDMGDLSHVEPLSDAERAEMTALFGPYGTRPWTGHPNLRALVDDVADGWGDENEQYLLRWIGDIHLRFANLQLHNTADSLTRPEYRDDGTALFDAGESLDGVASALLVSFWAFANIQRLVLTNGRRERLAAFYLERMPTFFQP